MGPLTATISGPGSAQATATTSTAEAESAKVYGVRGLPARFVPQAYLRYPTWFFVGCHGGAGTSTLNTAITGGWDARVFWPLAQHETTNVVLVARTHAAGLRAAQYAARVWAEKAFPPTVRLLGLAAVADAPGRLPKPLRQLLDLIAGGVPQIWQLPWVESLRLGDPADQTPLPSAYAAMAADLQQLVNGVPHA